MTKPNSPYPLPKIAIAIDSHTVPGWIATLLEQINSQQLAECLYIYFPITHQKTIASIPRLASLHLQLDEHRFQEGLNALQKTALLTDWQKLPSYSDSTVDQEKMVHHQAEVLLWLSEQTPPEDLLNKFKLGIWSYVHGKEEITQSDWLGYWEFANLEEVISSGLKISTFNHRHGKILFRSWSVMPALSISKARHPHFWKIAAFIPRALKLLQQKGPEQFLAQLNGVETGLNGQAPALIKPGLLSSGKHLMIHGNRLINKLWKKSNYREQWMFLYKFGQAPDYQFETFHKILPPKDRFWADPFLVKKEGKYFLFFEDLPFATDKGHLSVMEIKPDGTQGPIHVILEKEYHLSYPFIFEFESKLYMIPESYQANNIQLYECTNFPFKWEHKMNLMEEVCAMDTTLFFHDDKWWLFCTMSEIDGSSHHDELFLFYADHPFTKEWTPHPLNPIVSDVRSARPAGHLYKQGTRLIRPSQDCSRKYGYGFNLNEVLVLSTTEYKERRWKHVRPNWDKAIKRTHSFNFVDGLTIIDGLVQRRKF